MSELGKEIYTRGFTDRAQERDYDPFGCEEIESVANLEKENAELKGKYRWRDVNEELPENSEKKTRS